MIVDHSLAAEPVAEALRNALTILSLADRTGGQVSLSERDAAAVRTRIEAAIGRLESQ